MKSDLVSLAERVEQGNGEDRELDAEIGLALGKGYEIQWGQTRYTGETYPILLQKSADHVGGIARTHVPQWTSSLDAVVALIEERLPGIGGNCHGYDKEPKSVEACVSRNNVASGHWYHGGKHSTSVPRALLAALLRALAAQEPIP